MNTIFENVLKTFGLVGCGFLLGLLVAAAATDDYVKVEKDSAGLHVCHKDRLFRLVEINR